MGRNGAEGLSSAQVLNSLAAKQVWR